jgi:diguanylate cyclase (GGDEF)-like protein
MQRLWNEVATNGAPLQAAPQARGLWLEQLADAASPHDIAVLLLGLSRQQPWCSGATLAWNLDTPHAAAAEPPSAIDPWLPQLALDAAGRGVAVVAENGRSVVAAISATPLAALVLESSDTAATIDWLRTVAAPLRLAGRFLRRILELGEMRASLGRLEGSEQLQRALFAISDLAGSDRDMPEVLRGIHAIIGTLMYAENFFIVLHNAERGTIRFLYFADVEDDEPRDPGVEIPLASREHTLTWYVIQDGRPLQGTTEELRRQVSGPLVIRGSDSYDWLGVPMSRDGQVYGALVVQSYREGVVYSLGDQALLSFVGSHLLTALERRQSKDELEQRVRTRTLELADANQAMQLEIVERQRAERLQAALFQIAQLATADISQAEFYRRVHAVVAQLIDARNFFIALLSEDRTQLEFPYFVDAHEASKASRPLTRGLSEYVLRIGAAFRGQTTDIDALAARGEIDLSSAGSPSTSWLGVPLFVGDEAIGLVAVQSYDGSVVYDAADQELLTFAASQVAYSLNRRRAALIQQQAYAQLEQRVQERTAALRTEILERERIQELLKHQVLHDGLTGLPNRGYLRDRLERVLGILRRSPERRCALLYLDVDRFKVINDSLGHLAGDQVLKQVAERLRHCVRDPDIVARLSGDEFAILLEDAPVPGTAIKVGQRIIEAMAAPMRVEDTTLQVSASIGIAIGDDRYRIADDLVRDADIALYRSKQLGRGRFELFDERMQQNAIDVLALENELRVALQDDQFEPYFQPIVHLGDGRILGYEALLRWNHPLRGVLGPADFLQVAEDNGTLPQIDWRMFELSCTLAARHLPASTWLTINISPRHFQRESFDTRLLDMLRRTDLPPGRLVIEVTEGSLLEDADRVRAILQRLRQSGVGAALDDFGTGYSSLSYLHTFPLQLLKVDRSFIAQLPQDQGSATVVGSVLALAGALDMQVVAEGIETDAQHAALLAMGCELGQGYLLGRPAPIGHWIREAGDD